MMQGASRLVDHIGRSGRRLHDEARTLCRILPGEGWIGAAMVLIGLLLLPVPPTAWHVVIGCGLALLALTFYRIATGLVRPPAGTAIAAGIDSRVEDLKDVVWELRESEARYRDLLDTQEHVIARHDGEGRLTYVNKAFCRLFGLVPQDVLGRPWLPQVLAEEPAGPDAGGAQRRYVQLIDTAEGPRWLAFEEHRVPGQRAAGARHALEAEVQLVGSDVTTARAAQAELAGARDQAQAADRAKSRFLAAMSHEIRTPMNGIMGMAGLLGETPLNAEQRTYLGAIDQSARTLLVLIDEILDFSKIEAGKLELAAQPFVLDACVQGAVELLAPAAHEKGLEIAWTMGSGEPVQLVGDAARVRQIMLNLIGNAVKYTDRGGVVVRVACEGASRDSVAVAVSVKDTGIGLSREAIGRLFAEFNQGDGEAAQRRGGTGLGLAISRRLARAMGGDITVVSEPGQGSVFTVRLMLRRAGEAVRPGQAAAEGSPAAAAAGSVLLAFGRRIERKALADNLAAIGFCAIETDEPGACAAIAAAARPVLHVVCDAQADPAEAAAVLASARAHADGREVHGYLLIDPETRASLDQFRAAGFSSYLVRPVRPQALRARFGLEAATCDERTMPPAAPRAARTDFAQHVLLAEDNAVNALLATRMLEKAGCTVVHVGDGEQAIAAVARSLEGTERRFDLILMDMHMPRLDGLEAAAGIRALAGSGETGTVVLPPMVALTANAFSEDRQRCLAAGLDDYLAKPFHKSDLTAVLERWGRRAADTERPGKAA